MKIFYTIDTLGVGGAEKSLLEMCTTLGQSHEVTLIYFYPNHSLLPEFKSRGIRVRYLNVPGKYGFWNGYRKLLALCQDEKPDLLVGTLFRAEQMTRFVGKRLGIPVIGTLVQENRLFRSKAGSSFLQRLKHRCLWRLDRFSARYCVAFHAIGNTASISNSRRLRIPEEKITVIPRGRDIASYAAGPATRQGQGFRLLHVGRLIPGKGHLELLAAFEQFLLVCPAATLTLAGNGRLRSEIEQHIARRGMGGKVNLLGEVSCVPELLASHDLFVFPSRTEGLGGAVIEAMLAGIPVLASDIPALQELITPGRTGLLFAMADENDLLSKLVFARQNPELMREYAQRARAEAVVKFDNRIVCQRHEAFYRGLLAS